MSFSEETTPDKGGDIFIRSRIRSVPFVYRSFGTSKGTVDTVQPDPTVSDARRRLREGPVVMSGSRPSRPVGWVSEST